MPRCATPATASLDIVDLNSGRPLKPAAERVTQYREYPPPSLHLHSGCYVACYVGGRV
jgi:hypothetical protein